MSVAPDAVSLATYVAEEEVLRPGSPFSHSSVGRLLAYIVSNRDQMNNERHKKSNRNDKQPSNGDPWRRFPYSVSAYCSDQHYGDSILDSLSCAQLAAVPEAGEGRILDFSEAGYLVLKDQDSNFFESKQSNLGPRPRGEWRTWLGTVVGNNSIRRYLESEERPELARFRIIFFSRLRSLTQEELMRLFVSHNLSLQFLDMTLINDGFSWLGSSASYHQAKSMDVWYVLPFRLTFGVSTFERVGRTVEQCSGNILFPRTNVYLFRRPVSVYFRYENAGHNTTMIVLDMVGKEFVHDRYMESFENIDKLGYRDNPFSLHGVVVSHVLQEWKQAMMIVEAEIKPIEQEILRGDVSKGHTGLTNEIHQYLTTIHQLSSEIKGFSSTLKALRRKHEQFYDDILDTNQSRASNAFQRFDDFLSETIQKVDVWQNLLEESTKRAETAAALLFNRLTAILSISSRQDTTSMKVIAFFTMIYLPGSFVSSIFGWSIISFSVDEATNSQSIVVGEQWKWYVAITVSLTVATFVAFWSLQAADPEKEHRNKLRQGSSSGNFVMKHFKALLDWKLPWTKTTKKEITKEDIDFMLQRRMA